MSDEIIKEAYIRSAQESIKRVRWRADEVMKGLWEGDGIDIYRVAIFSDEDRSRLIGWTVAETLEEAQKNAEEIVKFHNERVAP